MLCLIQAYAVLLHEGQSNLVAQALQEDPEQLNVKDNVRRSFSK